MLAVVFSSALHNPIQFSSWNDRKPLFLVPRCDLVRYDVRRTRGFVGRPPPDRVGHAGFDAGGLTSLNTPTNDDSMPGEKV